MAHPEGLEWRRAVIDTRFDKNGAACGGNVGCTQHAPLLPVHPQPDLAVDAMIGAVESGLVVDVCVERGGRRHLQTAADPEFGPAFPEVCRERYEAGRRGNLGRRIGQELVPQVDAGPDRRRPRIVTIALLVFRNGPGPGYSRVDTPGQRIHVVETGVGRAVVEAVEIDRLVDELSLRRLNHRRPIGILRAG